MKMITEVPHWDMVLTLIIGPTPLPTLVPVPPSPVPLVQAETRPRPNGKRKKSSLAFVLGLGICSIREQLCKCAQNPRVWSSCDPSFREAYQKNALYLNWNHRYMRSVASIDIPIWFLSKKKKKIRMTPFKAAFLIRLSGWS